MTLRISNRADYAIERLQPLIDYFSPAKVEINQERVCFVAEVDGKFISTGALEGDELRTGIPSRKTRRLRHVYFSP
jgi:hypothetical protein